MARGERERQLAISCLRSLPHCASARPRLRRLPLDPATLAVPIRDTHAPATMRASTLFNTIAHCTTLYYYVHILRTIGGLKAEPSDPRVVHDFMDFRTKFFTIWGVVSGAPWI